MIGQQIDAIRRELKQGTRLVAVSKFHPMASLAEAYEAGQRDFGESYVQELQAKHEAMPKDIRWHFIGHLQSNKVKYIAPYVWLIHAVDSHKLLKEIGRQAVKCGRTISCLLQVHVAKEETKFGFSPDELREYALSGEWKEVEGVRIAGLMCMASNTDDTQRIAADFAEAETLFGELQPLFGEAFCEKSWGMTDDFRIAMAHGSTLVRIGSMIFGPRTYTT